MSFVFILACLRIHATREVLLFTTRAGVSLTTSAPHWRTIAPFFTHLPRRTTCLILLHGGTMPFCWLLSVALFRLATRG
jgi:hypothetical protein